MLESRFKKSCRSRPATLLKKETLTQLFLCENSENFKSTYLKEHNQKATSETAKNSCKSTHYRKTLKFVDKNYVEPKNEIIIAT